MATLEELQGALIKADAAGDTAAAKMLADHIRSMQQSEMPAQDLPAAAPAPEGGSALGNLGYGALKGAADLVQAPAQLALNAANSVAQKFPNNAASQFIGEKTKQFNDYLTNQENQYQQETPGSFSAGLGRAASNFLPFIFTGGASLAPSSASLGTKAAALGKLIGQGGAATALTQPVYNTETQQGGENDFLAQKALQSAIGAGAGLGGAYIGRGIGNMVNPSVRPEVLDALSQGITPTIGQIKGGTIASLENKAVSIPVLGDIIRNSQQKTIHDINRAAYDRALGPIGQSAKDLPVGHEGMLSVRNKLSNAYNDLMPYLNFNPDAKFSGDITALISKVNNGTMPPKETNQFNNIIKNNLLGKLNQDGNTRGPMIKEIQNDLRNLGKSFKGSMDPNQRNLGFALDDALSSMFGGIQRSSPHVADKLANIDKGYANYGIIRAAAKNPGAENGVFTPAMLNRAVSSQDKSVGKGNFATGKALMQDLANTAKSVAPTFQNSGTADRTLLASMLNNPVGAVGGLAAAIPASILYSQAGKNAMAKLLTQRPEYAPAIANVLQNQVAIPSSLLAGSLAQGR